MFRIILPLLLIFMAGINSVFSQTISSPNSALKSHETLDIVKIELSPDKTEICLKIENRITGGSFCADRKINIVYPDGTKSLLTSSKGIPVCPDAYKFKSPGEKLDFVLAFPPLKEGTKSIDLIEDCESNCFSFIEILLDNDLNKKINDAFILAENKEPARSLLTFTRLAEETSDNTAAEGLLYINIIRLSVMTGNSVRAQEYYKKLQSSGLAHKDLYLAHLNSLGIKY